MTDYPRLQYVRSHLYTCANVQVGSTFADKCDCGALGTAGKAIPVASMTPTQPTAITTEALIEKYAASMYGRIVGVPDHVIRQQFSEFAAALEAALSTAPSGDGVPGMMLVPREPDANMCMAGYDAAAHQIGVVEVARAYRAMLSASSTGKETP